MLARGVMLT